jgi:hypothetical protein
LQKTSLNDFTKNLELMGVKGNKLLMSPMKLGKWLETAKSQAEIDVAKAKFQEFQDKGVFQQNKLNLGCLQLSKPQQTCQMI